MGPVHIDPSWQARTPGAVDIAQFAIDWLQEQLTCPQGQHSVSWHRSTDAKGESIVQVIFAQETCQVCALRSRCTDARSTGRSMFPQERHEALQTARARQQTDAFKSLYRCRSAIEGTFCQTTRKSTLHQARYRGMPKTHLQHVVIATATTIVRLISWLDGVPFAKTRASRFAALAA
jgi:transposase